tara:strand:+ start:240 stop:359 length:120 start_codon:yes stop_codon:yes gene_type:complete
MFQSLKSLKLLKYYFARVFGAVNSPLGSKQYIKFELEEN